MALVATRLNVSEAGRILARVPAQAPGIPVSQAYERILRFSEILLELP
jgi:hypothetical protein